MSKNSLIDRFLMLEEISHEEALYTLNIIIALLVYAENSTVSIINKWYEQFAKNGIITVEDVKDVLTPSELRKFKSLLARYLDECRYYELEREYIEELEYTIKRNKINRLDMLKIQLKHCCYITYRQIYNELDSMVKKVYFDGYFGTIYEVQRYIGRWYKVDGIPEDMLNKLVYIAWSDDNWNIVKRMKQLRKWQVKDITNIVTKAIEFERPLSDTIFKISQISHKEKVRMGRITRTEQAFYNSLAQFNAYKTLGIEKYQIIAVIDDRTSDICRSLNGTSYLLEDYEVFVTAPPFHPNCRSTTRPYVEEIEETEKDPETGETDASNNMTYKEWMDKYGVGSQEKASKTLTKGKKHNKVDMQKKAKINYKDIQGEHSFKLDARRTNPNYNPNDPAYSENCIKCVPTYEMRRRGYDVEAKSIYENKEITKILQQRPDKVWINPNIINAKEDTNFKLDIVHQMNEWGDGARCQIVLASKKLEDGHTIVAEQIHGKTVFIDPQNGELDPNHFKNLIKQECVFYRIDNLNVSDYILGCCKEIDNNE